MLRSVEKGESMQVSHPNLVTDCEYACSIITPLYDYLKGYPLVGHHSWKIGGARTPFPLDRRRHGPHTLLSFQTYI